MLVRQCDHCGRIYETKSVKINNRTVDAIATLELYGFDRYQYGKEYDLCPGCLEELKNWLENKQEELK